MTILSKSILAMGLLTLELTNICASAMDDDNDFNSFMMRPIMAADFLRVINQQRQEGERYLAATAKRTHESSGQADNEGPAQKKLKKEELEQSLNTFKNHFDIATIDLTTFQEFVPEINSIINQFMLSPNFTFKKEYEELYTGNPGQLAIMTKFMIANSRFSYPGVIHWFVVAQPWNVANFTSWDLSCTRMGINDIRVLAKTLQKNKTLTTLNLSDTNATNSDMCQIAEMLKKNNTLKELNLSSNLIQDSGLSSLITVLALFNSTLSHLDLSENNFHSEICHSLGMFLEKYTSLTCLILNRCGWSRTLVMSPLAKALKKNKTLTELSLLDNSVNADQIEILLDAVEKNTTLKKLTLYYPNVESGVHGMGSSDEEEMSNEDSCNHEDGLLLVKEFTEKYGNRINFYDS